MEPEASRHTVNLFSHRACITIDVNFGQLASPLRAVSPVGLIRTCCRLPPVSTKYETQPLEGRASVFPCFTRVILSSFGIRHGSRKIDRAKSSKGRVCDKQGREREMKQNFAAVIGAGMLLLAMSEAAFAQKQGGILRMYHFDSPASLSPHEEVTFAALGPTMGLFNNIVMFDQHVPQTSLQSIVPDLATQWSWDAGRTRLTFRLRDGVKWHDGNPFSAKDVKCTWDTLLGIANEKFRLNPRKSWYRNLEEVTVNGDNEVMFRLKRQQPSFIALLASGWSPVYPCHVSPREMRTHPIGTGPFKFVEFKPNESIKVARNPDYWKKDWPLLDGIDYTIIKNASTRVLAFIAGKFDMTTPYNLTIPLMRDIQSQVPQAICELTPTNVNRNLIINRDKPPFDNPEIRRAMALTLDRKAFIDTINEGKADIGAAMLPPPEGIWGMPPEMLKTLPGYDPDVAKNRGEAHKIMQKAGYSGDNRLKITVSTRNIPQYRDPAVILIDQLKQIYIDADLEEIDTVNWYPKVMRKDFTVGLNLGENGLDDPDQTFYENFACGAERNYTGYSLNPG
jgi:peptide/nickel transport system substrate-binding protein